MRWPERLRRRRSVDPSCPSSVLVCSHGASSSGPRRGQWQRDGLGFALSELRTGTSAACYGAAADTVLRAIYLHAWLTGSLTSTVRSNRPAASSADHRILISRSNKDGTVVALLLIKRLLISAVHTGLPPWNSCRRSLSAATRRRRHMHAARRDPCQHQLDHVPATVTIWRHPLQL
jgi:hypothetical protein